jgi:hypothetical protein
MYVLPKDDSNLEPKHVAMKKLIKLWEIQYIYLYIDIGNQQDATTFILLILLSLLKANL